VIESRSLGVLDTPAFAGYDDLKPRGYLPRHCERSEAIHLFACLVTMDCFAPLAMTGKQPGSDRRGCRPAIPLFFTPDFSSPSHFPFAAKRFMVPLASRLAKSNS